MYGFVCFFVLNSLKSDVVQHGKQLLSNCFPIFCVSVRVVMLPAYCFVPNGTRLGLDG